MNDGPLCRCSWKAKQTGIRHNFFPNESVSGLFFDFHPRKCRPFQEIPACDPNSNNLSRLHHYVMRISPLTNIDVSCYLIKL